jgi:competence protein ComFB
MNIHNTTEDMVLQLINELCVSLEKDNPDKICTCAQCRLDTACYVLNRARPRYIVSNRGAARAELDIFECQQDVADLTTLIHEGFKRVNQIQRPNSDHSGASSGEEVEFHSPVFNIPTIIGRVFNGIDFSPMTDTVIELRREGEVVTMKDQNWQNPYKLVSNTAGTFTFWPIPLKSKFPDQRKEFEYSVKITAPGYDELNHFFKIPSISEFQAIGSFAMNRTFKLPDLYVFPESDEDEQDF